MTPSERSEGRSRSGDLTGLGQSEILKLISSSDPVAMGILDAKEFRIEWCNDMYEMMTKEVFRKVPNPASRDGSIIGARLSDLTDAFERSGALRPYRQVAESGQPYQEEAFETITSLGLRYWQWKILPLKQEDGQVAHLMTIFVEVTTQVNDRISAEHSEAKYRGLFENIEEGLQLLEVVRDDAGKVIDIVTLDVNSAYEEQVGINGKDLIGKSVRQCFPSIEQEWWDAIGKVEETGVPIKGDNFNNEAGKTFEVHFFRCGKGQTGVMFRDITERKNAKEALLRSQRSERARCKELETIMDIVPATIWISRDREGTDIVGNKAVQELLGVPPGANVSETAPLEQRQQHFLAYRNDEHIPPEHLPIQETGLTGRALLGYEFEMRFEDGRSVWLYGNVVPLYEEAGSIRGAVGAFVDITERKRAEDALKESEAKFRDLFETVQEVFYIDRLIYDEQGNVVDWVFEDLNPAGFALIGLEKLEQAKGKRGSEVLGRKTASFYLPMIEEARRSSKAVTFQYQSPHVDREFLTSYIVHGDRLISAQMDVTDIKRAQRQAEEERARLQAVLEAAPIGIFIGDKEGRAIVLNKVFDEFWGGSPYLMTNSERPLFIGRNSITGETINVNDWPAIRALKGEASSLVADIQRYDGKKATLTVAASPLLDSKGVIMGSVIVSQDITAMHDMQRELRDHVTALARSNAELQQFAYVASHDLQEPLRMVISYIGLLNKKHGGELSNEAKHYMHFINDGAERMRQLVTDLLQYSRIETQGKPFGPVDMNIAVTYVLKALRVAIDERGAEVIADPLPTIWADDTLMAQVLQNLIANALKFHGPEAPRVEITSRQNAGEHIIAVKDNGIGIDPKYRDKVFQMFQRLHTRDEYEGTGIGLAISKKIIERHGGRIWFESDGQNGSTFFFTIPKSGGGI